MPVYLSGLPVDMDRLYAIARDHKLRVIEDAAQAFGSTWNGERIGKLGDIVSFSFHANKNLTSIEGGALVLNNEEEAVLAQKYRLQGITRTGFDGMDCDVLGGKYNLTDVAARVGLGQLPHLERFIAQRQQAGARAISQASQGGAAAKLGVGLPFADFDNSNWHMFQITLPLEKLSIDRAGFMGATEGTRHRLGRALSGASTCSRCTARAASRKACSRMRSASARPRSRCRSSR